MQATAYRFRNNPSRGCRYSIYVQRFITDAGTRPVLEWFHTMEDAIAAAEEMQADGRFYGISSYVRSLATADSRWG
jgi:ABC-type proline/glycine betaine transport system substrate-binding protein